MAQAKCGVQLKMKALIQVCLNTSAPRVVAQTTTAPAISNHEGNKNMMSIVSLREVSKNYRLGKVLVRALQEVSLDIEEGEFLAIAGPSGSGKTTILNLIGCVDTPSTGTVLVDGSDVGKLDDARLTRLRLNTIGFVFQSFNLVGVLDVFRNVELPLLLQQRLRKSDRTARVRDLLARVGLSRFARHRPSELSGGQRQRVAIARALVTGPKLILADEPTANLDSATGQTIIDLMKEINRTQGTTFVFSTHDVRVMSHASHVIRLADGSLEPETRAVQRTSRFASEHLIQGGVQ